MKLWFETHSTSVHNERGIASGHIDFPLPSKGQLEAQISRQFCFPTPGSRHVVVKQSRTKLRAFTAPSHSCVDIAEYT